MIRTLCEGSDAHTLTRTVHACASLDHEAISGVAGRMKPLEDMVRELRKFLSLPCSCRCIIRTSELRMFLSISQIRLSETLSGNETSLNR